jgi:hypothetical protein
MDRKLAAIVSLAATFAGLSACSEKQSARIESTPVERGAYLSTIGGCNDCHSPKIFGEHGPQPDPKRILAGHPAEVPVPEVPAGVIAPDRWGALTNSHLTAWAGPWGISYAANLTPDATGLASWTEEIFIQAMRTGKHAGVGRPILPPMPWFDIGKMTDADLKALFAYLKSLPPVANAVPEPVPPAGPPPGAAPVTPPPG